MSKSKDNHVLKKIFKHCSKLIFKIKYYILFNKKKKE